MRLPAVIASALAAVALTACGTTHVRVVAPPPSSVRAPAPAVMQPETCPAGNSFMGCSAPPAKGPGLSLGSRPAGRYFVDVSDWQGRPDWAAAKPHIIGAVDKLGEGTFQDSSAAFNIGEQKWLHIPFVVYWFVRPDGCAREGQALERDAKALKVSRIVLDEEVGGIQGYAACLGPYVIAATGQHAVVYRSAGNDFDTSAAPLGCWVAAYGPSSPPSCFGRHPIAFQFTDGRFGFPVYVPGVGQGDVSVDYGLFANAPAVVPYAALQTIPRHFGSHPRVVARERETLLTALHAGCTLGRARGRVCRSSRTHALLLQHRVYVIATHHGRLPRGRRLWGRDHLGIRYHEFAVALARKSS